MDGQMDGWMDGRTDRPSYRDAFLMDASKKEKKKRKCQIKRKLGRICPAHLPLLRAGGQWAYLRSHDQLGKSGEIKKIENHKKSKM